MGERILPKKASENKRLSMKKGHLMDSEYLGGEGAGGRERVGSVGGLVPK